MEAMGERLGLAPVEPGGFAEGQAAFCLGGIERGLVVAHEEGEDPLPSDGGFTHLAQRVQEVVPEVEQAFVEDPAGAVLLDLGPGNVPVVGGDEELCPPVFVQRDHELGLREGVAPVAPTAYHCRLLRDGTLQGANSACHPQRPGGLPKPGSPYSRREYSRIASCRLCSAKASTGSSSTPETETSLHMSMWNARTG
jgi:hypothetical protein